MTSHHLADVCIWNLGPNGRGLTSRTFPSEERRGSGVFGLAEPLRDPRGRQRKHPFHHEAADFLKMRRRRFRLLLAVLGHLD